MKSKPRIRSLFSLSQLEMAMVLGISESLWSMHELGLRSLPLGATQLLAAMVAHAKSPEVTARSAVQPMHCLTRQQEHLESLLREKEFQQVHIAKKIEVVTKRIDAAAKRRQIAEFLDSRKSEKSSLENGIVYMISAKASKTLNGEDPIALVEYQIRQDAIELEKLVIESKLRKIKQSLDSGNTIRK